MRVCIQGMFNLNKISFSRGSVQMGEGVEEEKKEAQANVFLF